MTLPDSYLAYPHRRHGYDHDLYPWSALSQRPPVRWPSRARVAVWPVVSVEFFPLAPSDTPFRAPGHMQTPYPDYRHFTARDYGTRVGLPRLLDAFASVGAKAGFACNSVVATRTPGVIDDILRGGHEVVAHSTDMNGTIASGLPEEDERALIEASLATLAHATGRRPQGWLSIARSQSWNTPRLLAEAGVRYQCDWVNDELPYRFTNGLVNLPLNHELSDRQIIATQQQSADSYAQQIEDAFDRLDAEARESGGGRMLPLHVTPYIIALPYRIGAFETLLTALANKGAWFATGSEIIDAWEQSSPLPTAGEGK